MRIIWRRSIVCLRPVALIGLLLAVFLIYVSGCSGLSRTGRDTKQLYKGLSGSTGVCNKIMLFLPFENSVQWLSIDLDASFAPKLRDAILKEYGRVRILLPEDPNFPVRFNRMPRPTEGDLNSADLAASGRASGINMVLSGRLVSIRHDTEDRGMFWFAKVAHLARVQMEITVYHTGTGAKLLSRTVFQDIDISEAEASLINTGEMPNATVLPEALTDIAETMGKNICNVISRIPWEGYVTGVEGDRVILSAGEACGLKKGMALRVYGAHEVDGKDGGAGFIVPGKSTGTITVTTIHADHCEAVLKDGGPILPGNIVRIN